MREQAGRQVCRYLDGYTYLHNYFLVFEKNVLSFPLSKKIRTRHILLNLKGFFLLLHNISLRYYFFET